MYKIFLIGTSDNGLSADKQQLVNRCSLLVGTDRLQKLVKEFSGKRIPISPIATSLQTMGEVLNDGHVAVLAGGDPLFYGIGRRLLNEFSGKNVEIHPAPSAVQRAAARFKIPWDDAEIISLHGRKNKHIPGLLLLRPKTFVFTDHLNSPDNFAGQILNYLELIGDQGQIEKNLTVHVAENLDLDGEKIFSGSLSDTAKRTFSPLNIFCLTSLAPENTAQAESQNEEFGLGLTEDEISHSRGLITKNEVRAITLHQLRLPRTGVFWDVGGGSGSVSIEAARNNPGLTVYTMEHKAEELENIKENIRRFRAFNVVPVFGRAPETLSDLPAPDRVFIGGSSGSLADIIRLAAARLPEGGRMVVNGVIRRTTTEAPKAMAECGLSVSQSLVRVSRSSDDDDKPFDFNPITVMTGINRRGRTYGSTTKSQ